MIIPKLFDSIQPAGAKKGVINDRGILMCNVVKHFMWWEDRVQGLAFGVCSSDFCSQVDIVGFLKREGQSMYYSCCPPVMALLCNNSQHTFV